MSEQPPPFVRIQLQENRTPTGRRTATPARRAARYIAYGQDREAREAGRQRGIWLGPDGRAHSHEAVLDWARREGVNYRYTGHVVLSPPQDILTPAHFCRAMAASGEIASWRLMAHDDTRFRHAHVLFFREERIPKARYLAWHARMQQALTRLEREAQSQAAGLDHDLTPREKGRAQRHGWGLG
jgi:hypothetical protein